MDAENGFLIDRRVYEVPSVFDLTLDEAEVLYERCGLVVEDFFKEDGETDEERMVRLRHLTRHPGYVAALMHIAYQRGNPDTKPGRVKLVLGKTNQLDAFSTLEAPKEEPDAPPLASTSEPNEASTSGSLENENSTKDSSGSSGRGSESGSDERGGDLVSIGTSRSDTSSTSAPVSSAASGPAT